MLLHRWHEFSRVSTLQNNVAISQLGRTNPLVLLPLTAWTGNLHRLAIAMPEEAVAKATPALDLERENVHQFRLSQLASLSSASVI